MSGSLLLPVGPRRMSSWADHQRRNPRSTEAGTDFYCPKGTTVVAPWSGRIYGAGDSIKPATGRWVGIDLDTGQRFRCMHHSKLLRVGGRVEAGEPIAISGASGYGVEDWSGNPNTGGAHTHATLWPTHASRYGYNPVTGRPYTIDLMDYVTSGGGGGSGGFLMALNDAEQAELLNKVRASYAADFGPANIPAPEMIWTKPFGEPMGVAYYGSLDIQIATHTAIGTLSGQIAALTQLVTALGTANGQEIDLTQILPAIEAAAEKGAGDMLSRLVLRPAIEGPSADAMDATLA